jgi:hypothetical protein
MAGRSSSTPAGQPQAMRVEIRVGGRVLFSQDCYDVELGVEDDVVKLNGALHPTLVEVTKNPPTRFEPDDDPRDGEEVIQKVHTGSRQQTAAPQPKRTKEQR